MALTVEKTERESISRAVLWAVGGGVVASCVWYLAILLTGRHLSPMAVGVGFLVSAGLIKGTAARGWKLQFASASITLMGLVATEYFAVRLLGIRYLTDQGIASDIPLWISPSVAWDFVSSGILADPLTPIFFGVSLWFAVVVPARRSWDG